MDSEGLGAEGARCSSTDSLGEFRPSELIVEDLPLLCRWARVGDEWPECECVEPGRNRAVAGDAWDLAGTVTARFWGGGVVAPFLDGALESVGVAWALCEGFAGDGSEEEPGFDATMEELDLFGSSVKDGLFLGWR